MEKWMERLVAWVAQGKSVSLPSSLRSNGELIGQVVSDFANGYEASGEDWRVQMSSPRHEWTVETFREILRHQRLPSDTVYRHAARGKHGYIYCDNDDSDLVRGVHAQHVLWVVQSDKEDVWDAVVSRLEPGHSILSFGWVPERYWRLFVNLVPKESKIKLPIEQVIWKLTHRFPMPEYHWAIGNNGISGYPEHYLVHIMRHDKVELATAFSADMAEAIDLAMMIARENDNEEVGRPARGGIVGK